MSLTGPQEHAAARSAASTSADLRTRNWGLEQRQQVVTVPAPAGEGSESFVPSEGFQPQDREHALEEFVLGARDDDPGVGGLEVLERHQRRVGGVPGPLRDIASAEMPGAQIVHHAHRCLMQ